MQAHSRGGLCASLLIVALVAPTALAQEGKQAIPSAAAQAKIVQLIHELYQDDLAKAARNPLLKSRLAQTLLQEGKDTTDDAAGRYVLLREAHILAAEGGDVPTALQAAEELAQGFQIPPAELFQMKVKTLSTAAAAPQAPAEAYQGVVDSALLLLEDTLTADDFPSSLALLGAADKAALKLRNVSLVASIRKRRDEVRALHKEYARWEPHAQALAQDPKDARANEEMGYYYALIKGNWDKGLPMLARGEQPAAQIARAEVEANGVPAIVATAAAWEKLGRAAKDLPRIHALLHAYQLYLQVLPFVDRQERAQVELHLQAITKTLPAEYRAGEITSELRRIDSSAGPIYDAAFSPDGRKVVATAYDGSLRLWDARTGKEQRRLDGHLGKIWAVAFHPDGRHVVSGGFDGTVRLWDLASARELKRFTGHTDYVRAVAVAADGKHILSGGDDRLLRLWSVETGKEVRAFPGHDHSVWSVALARDGKLALSASLDKTVRLWDTATGTELKKLVGHRDTVLAVAFTPDGRHALSGSTDKTLILWDLESGKPVQTYTGHKGYVQHVAISPDGRFALSAGADATVRLWDVAAGTELRTLEGHRDPVWSVAFSRDGRIALSAGQDQSVRVWGGSR